MIPRLQACLHCGLKVSGLVVIKSSSLQHLFTSKELWSHSDQSWYPCDKVAVLEDPLLELLPVERSSLIYLIHDFRYLYIRDV